MNRLDLLENLAPYKIFRRGVEYFESGAVSELEETSPGEWTATVNGTDDYYVEISLEENEITDWYCDCPYDGGDVCKHVIAALLAIRETQKKVSKSTLSKKNNKKTEAVESIITGDTVTCTPSGNELQQRLLSVQQKDLLAFVLEYASANSTFKEALLKKFISPKVSGSVKDYRAEIRKCFELYYRRGSNRYSRHDFSERNWEATFNKLDHFLNEALLLLKYDGLDSTIAIALQTLQSIGEEYDDELVYNEDLQVSDYCERAGDLLLEVIRHPQISQKQKNEVLQELCQLVKLYPYKDYDVYELEELMQQINILVQPPGDALKLIDQLLEERKDSWELYKLVLQKVELLHKMNEPKRAEDTMRRYLYLTEIRKMEVDKLILNAQYDNAIELLDEGIRLSKEDGNSEYQIKEWMKLKLQIYENTNRTSAIMGICRQLFITSQGGLEYYRKLKQVVPTEKWRLFLSSMMNETSFSHSFSWGNNNMTDIYVEEKDHESLFQVILSCSGREQLDGLIKYAYYLKNEYSEVLISLFASHLFDYAEKNLGRNHYEFVAQGLVCMQKLNGGTVAVKHLLLEFRTKYKRRSAMMEILDKV